MHQQLSIIGNVGRDPELRYTQQGVAVTSINVAVNKKWKNDAGEQQEQTTWFRVSCWRRTAEVVAEYVKRGSLVHIIADDVKANVYTDREGNARASLDCTAQTVTFLNTPRSGGNGDNTTPTEHEDIPF